MRLASRLVPPGVMAVEMRDTGQDVPLHPAEAMLVEGAVDKRRREFALGRACARAALAGCGVADAIIGQDAARRPVWPGGMVGSITHTRIQDGGYAAALAAPATRHAGLGVDAECVGGMTENLFSRLFLPEERAALAACAADDKAWLATLLFTAKEACFKAAHPLTDGRLSFSAIAVTVTGDAFLGHVPGRQAPVPGRHATDGDLVVSCAWIAR